VLAQCGTLRQHQVPSIVRMCHCGISISHRVMRRRSELKMLAVARADYGRRTTCGSFSANNGISSIMSGLISKILHILSITCVTSIFCVPKEEKMFKQNFDIHTHAACDDPYLN